MVNRELASIVQQRPVLWVGAGLSVAAGYPGTSVLLSAMRAAAPCDLPDGDFTQVVDAFIEATSPGELGDLLQRLFQAPHEPTAMHGAIARLAAAGRFTALVTTNYDDLLEVALRAVGVKVVVQILEDNAEVREQDGALRLIKLHGSYTAWQRVILSGRSYLDFEARYTFLREQLDVLLQQHPLLFTGCSLQDPRVLRWIESRSPEWLQRLKRWRALLQPAAWAAAQDMTWNGGKAAAVLARVPLRPIEYSSHAELPALWLQVAKELAPLAVRELVFDLHPGEHEWRSVGPTTEFAPHTASNPLGDDEILRDLRRLRTLLRQPIQVSDSRARVQEAELRHVASRVGSRLAATLLSPAAREAVRVRMAEVDRGTARLTLRVAEGPLADRVLALPWELLVLEDGRFAVERAELDVVRDAVKPGAPVLEEASAPLSVAAIIAAPEDQTGLYYEDESYRLLKALAPLGQVAHFAELGEIEDLVETVRRTDATAMHFSGHGLPGKLVFEDELGLSKPIAITDLTTRMRQRVQESGVAKPFPRLFYLASCHGASSTSAPAGGSEPDTRALREELTAALGEGPSTAATLHREGFACVLGYFGPIGDAISTSAEVALYTSLSQGATVLHSVKQARVELSKPHTHAEQPYVYPLGWAQLAVYLRGPDRALTARKQSADATPRPPQRLVREMVEVSGLPVLQHGFIGRRALQHEVRRKLNKGQRLLVLQGLGGLGKTALASHLLHKILAREPTDQLILRVQDAADVAALRAQAEAHGDTHHLPGWTDTVKQLHEHHPAPVEGFKQTVLALRAHRPQLVLYADNMEALQVGPGGAAELEPGALGSWRPDADRWWAAMEELALDGVVLASTRYLWRGLDPDALIPLERMSRADLWRMLDTFPTLAKLPWAVRGRVVDIVDGRPRTLELLEGLLHAADRDPTRDLTDAWAEWVVPTLTQHGAVLTEDLLLARLWRCLSQAARDHAIAASVLGQPAPRRVLDVLGSATRELVGAGLFTRHREITVDQTGDQPRLVWKDRWSMHASVQQFSSAWGSADALRGARTRAADEYAALVREPGALWSDQLAAIDLYLANEDGITAWPLAREYVLWLRGRVQYRGGLQMLERFERMRLTGDAHVEHTALIAQLRGSAGIRVDTTEAELRRSIELSGVSTAKGVALHELASLLTREGKYGEAEDLLRELLAIEEKALGREHPNYCATLHSLTGVLSRQGKYGEAESLLRELLTLVENTLGREHLPYGASLHSLGGVLSRQGKYGEAEGLLRESLAIYEKALGREHPDYGVSLHELAGVLSFQGEYGEAEGLLRESLAIDEKALGREHPSYGASLHELAGVLSKQGKYGEAEGLLRESLAIYEKALGREHPDYGVSQHELAGVLSKQGEYGEAEGLLRDSLSLVEKALGREHPSYGASLHELAGVLSKQGRSGEAEGLLREALAIYGKAVGRAHPDHGASLHSLAGELSSQGKHGEAEGLLREALAIDEKTLGREHPNYGASLHSLAGVLSRQGKYGEAEGLLRESLVLMEKALGREHPSLCPMLANLAIVAANQGRAREGIPVVERALRIALVKLGEDHPETKQVQHILAQLRGTA